MTKDRFRRLFLLFVVIAVSAGFLVMLRSFLITILSAAIFTGFAYPLYAFLNRHLRSRPLAALTTLLLVIVLVVGPLLAVVTVVVNQAIRVSADVGPVIGGLLGDPAAGDAGAPSVPAGEDRADTIAPAAGDAGAAGAPASEQGADTRVPAAGDTGAAGPPAGQGSAGDTIVRQILLIPGMSWILPYRQIIEGLGAAINTIGSFLVSWLSGATRMTVTFIFHFFLMLYTMFFLLMDGPRLLARALDHLPLSDEEKDAVKDRFLSVTRATIKGTIVIGLVQGALAGFAFWMAGIPNSLFWAVVMMVLSILPVVGGALVWVPASIVLALTGKMLAGVLLAVFCGLVVGSVDNVLRPRLVGRDTKMHDLLILFSTLGGLVTIGPVGFIVGPILAGLFVTSWELFARAYRDVLTE